LSNKEKIAAGNRFKFDNSSRKANWVLKVKQAGNIGAGRHNDLALKAGLFLCTQKGQFLRTPYF